MRVPFLDLKVCHDEARSELDAAYRTVVDSGWFIRGQQLSAFENQFAEYCGAKHCVGVGNGLDALTLILEALGIGPGDEVLVPSHTFVATWLAVSRVGATPVPVEPGCDYNMDPSRISQLINARTRAVIPVHLYGSPAPMDAVREIAEENGLKIVEDAAQAHGARYRGASVGALSDAAAFSFYPGKNLGALGDGGAVVTNNSELAGKISQLGNYGSREKYHHQLAGCNSRLDELQAALLLAKLPLLESWNDRRRRIAGIYLDGLVNTGLVLPVVPIDCTPVWHLFVVQTENREHLQGELWNRGIETQIHYPIAPHNQPVYMRTHKGLDLAIADNLQERVLSLPMGPHLSDEQAMFVVSTLRELCL